MRTFYNWVASIEFPSLISDSAWFTRYFIGWDVKDLSKIVIFYDPEFPYEGVRPETLAFAHTNDRNVIVAGADDITDALEEHPDVLVHLHGPYFPKTAWPAVYAHLQRGGGLVTCGGAPFRIPVCRINGMWRAEPEQTAYLQQLNIHEALPVDPAPIARLASEEQFPWFAGKEHLFTIEPTCGLILHATRSSDWPSQEGSSGPMDAHIYPLLKGISKTGREVAAPAVLIENTKGPLAGGRWILIQQTLREPFWQGGGSEALLEWADYCARGVTEIWLKPNYAGYEPGERPLLTLQLQSLHARNEGTEWTFAVTVRKEAAPAAETVLEQQVTVKAEALLQYVKLPVPVAVEPGMYSVVCRAESAAGEVRVLRQGFWGIDRELLRQGEPMSCGRDYFRKNGKPMPIVGMTYMTSDVARKFLFLPNAAVWDRDMANMKRAGINLIRTGIWTAWRNVMFVDGHPSEEVLRAIDAFILTARKHDLEVTFTFFAFTPEMWEGENPYLDPRSVEAQKRFIAAIVSRHAETTNVQWDLINEPSMFDPDRLWAPNPRGDRYERAAFIAWLKERHGDIRTLQERWGMTPDQLPSFESVRTPERGQISFATTERSPKRGGPWLDFVLFSMDMHNRWANELRAAIKQIQPKQLVTVGQDEGLGAQRPSPLFYEEAVDYTTVHSWWLNDQLVWDGIFAKAPYKPNLIQETGIMYVETPEGKAKRSEYELRNILERKYAYAFSTGGAGAVQWIWNTNYYMNNINESNIGALRADGTEKPEADVSYDFGDFMSRIGHLFEDRELEDIAVVYPYSNDFSNRPFAVEATAKLTRTFVYELKTHFRALGEYRLQALDDQPAPKLIIVPSAHNFSDEALEELIGHVAASGATLLVTGPLSLDAYWRPTRRLESRIGPTILRNILREERLLIGGKAYPASFGGNRIAQLNVETPADSVDANGTSVRQYSIGQGTLLWCPLPVELNDRIEPIAALYRYAMKLAGIKQEMEWRQGGDLSGVYGRRLQFRDGALYIFVSEYAHDAEVEVADPAAGAAYRFKLERERTVMFAVDRSGALLAVYRPEEVSIEVIR
jgi:hypothetical protein